MLKRNYKNTNLSISVLGLGCMRLPKINPDKGDIDYEKAQEIIDYAITHGINYFDTAYMYHDGTSEKFLGHALKKYDRSSYFLTTKMPVWMVDTPQDIERIFNDQLEKLQTDYLDFYLLHSLTKEHFKKCKEFKLYDFLSEKKEKGIIRHLGFSFHDTPDVLREICDTYEWDVVQIQLNYLDWEVQDAKQQYEILEQRHIPCIIMEPVRGGALASLCDTSNKIFKAARPDKSIASWAIRYAATLPNVMTVLSGMSTMDQIIDNVNTMTNFEPLNSEDYKTIEKSVAAYKTNITIPCTGCRYCMPCPQGVSIPKIFKLYNEYAISKNKDGYKTSYNKVPESERINNCIACGKCATHCPQSIEIPEKLKTIKNLTEELFAK